MKRFYEIPDAKVINLAAMERIALLEGHPDEGVAAASDDYVPNPSGFGVGDGRPNI